MSTIYLSTYRRQIIKAVHPFLNGFYSKIRRILLLTEDYFIFIFCHSGQLLCKMAFAFPILGITSASYSLAMMAFGRRNCVVDSLKTKFAMHHCKFIIPAIWMIAVVAAIPNFIAFDVEALEKIGGNGTEIYCSCNNKRVPHSFVISNGIMILFVTYVTPLCIIVYNYSRIIHFVVHQKGFTNGDSSATAVVKSTLLKKRMKMIKMLILVAVVFAASWLPYFISLIIAVSFTYRN